jgi:hypothetical protein
MAGYRRHYDEAPRRPERDWSDRADDEGRPWFSEKTPRREERASYATGSYRTDDRGYHDRYRRGPEREEYPYRGRDDRDDAADEYYRAAREQRDEFMRYEAQSPGAEFEHHRSERDFMPRERGGYWRQYEGHRGRGPKDYQRSDDRVREEICDCMTDDPLLDASDVDVRVASGVVTLSGTVSSRAEKRRAEDVAERVSGVKDVTNQLRVHREGNGHAHPASQPVSRAYGTETPSKSSGTTT